LLITSLLRCAGKQDDLAIALQLAMIGCQKARFSTTLVHAFCTRVLHTRFAHAL